MVRASGFVGMVAALAGVAAILAGCVASAYSVARQTCAVREQGTQTYLVTHFVGTATQVKEDCLSISGATGRQLIVVARTAYAGLPRVCEGDGYAIYAKRRDVATLATCDAFASPNRRVTIVLRARPSPGQTVYVVLRGPPRLTRLSAQQFPPPKQVVRKARGTRGCLLRHSAGGTLAVYSPSKKTAASFCHTLSAARR